MIDFLEERIQSFRPLFARERTFKWFVLLILSFILREDHLGVTSAVRTLLLNGRQYPTILHNFRSDGYDNTAVRKHWYSEVLKSAPLLRIADRVVLVGDDVKQSKEGYYMPGVQKHHQDSEDSSKGAFIYGHLFGAVGVVVQKNLQAFCLPLKARIHVGVKEAAYWHESTISPRSSTVQMIEDAFECTQTLGAAILLLDRYFLSIPTLRRLAELNEAAGSTLLSVVTKAKKNIRAYEKPVVSSVVRRGRPRKKGAPVNLSTLFETASFTRTEAVMYGETDTVEYYMRDLLWGTGLYQELRFVLVKYDGMQSILVSTDLSLDPVTIIELYAHRFKIESMFREFKQQLGGFGYHFWTKSIGKLNHFRKTGEPDELSKVTSARDRENVLKTIDATERFVMIGCIAMGLIQMLILREPEPERIRAIRYTRTATFGKVSEATLIYYLQRTLLLDLATRPTSMLNRYIQQARGVDKDIKMAG